MKFLVIFLAVSLFAEATPTDPGKAAIDFLEKVRLRQLNLKPGGDTALSSQIVAEKKERIARRLDRMAQDIGTEPLELGAMKMDEDFAAVLVRKVNGFDPSDFRVFPVAMVKRGDSWAPAPVPASFENVDKSNSATLRERLRALENWMLREQVSDLESLRADFSRQVLQKIQKKLPTETLRQANSAQVVQQFLTACQQRDAPSLLGFLGGLSDPLPDDWPRRLKAVDRALKSNPAPSHPWRLLVAPEVTRIIVRNQEEPDEGLVSIACLDPVGHEETPDTPQFRLINLELVRNSNQLWQINLADSFLESSPVSAADDEETSETSNPDLLGGFPEKWFTTHPPTPQLTPELAHQMMTAAFQEQSPTLLLKLAKIDTEPEAAKRAFVEAVKLWWSIRNPIAFRSAIPLAFKPGDHAAVGLFQLFSTREPNQFNPRPVYFEKTSSGWLWNPNPPPAILLKFDEWIAAENQRWPNQWQDNALSNSIQLDNQFPLAAPIDPDARKVVEQWLAAIQRGDFPAALAFTAHLKDDKSGSIALQNLGYEISGSRNHTLAPTITGIYQGKTWSAVGVKITQGGKVTYPLFPLIQTPSGPRVVIEIDLVASTNRNRNFLNKEVLGRLAKLTSPALTDDLRALNSRHQASVETINANKQ